MSPVVRVCCNVQTAKGPCLLPACCLKMEMRNEKWKMKNEKWKMKNAQPAGNQQRASSKQQAASSKAAIKTEKKVEKKTTSLVYCVLCWETFMRTILLPVGRSDQDSRRMQFPCSLTTTAGCKDFLVVVFRHLTLTVFRSPPFFSFACKRFSD